jgi:ankyrin repeat protein
MQMPHSTSDEAVFERLEPHWRHVMDDDANYIPLTRVDQLNQLGEAPLHIAARHGTDLDVRSLLALGADVNQLSEFGMTPLHYAYMGGRTENVEILLGAGADPTARTRFGLLPAGGSTAEALKAEWDQCW